MRQPKIAIIGGSLVGPTAELFLRKEGFKDVTTYEALPKVHSQSGGVMGVRLATVDVLESVGIDRKSIVALPDETVYAYDIIDGVPWMRGKSAFPGQVTSWDALYDILSHRVDAQRGFRLNTMNYVDGRFALRFANGQQREADVVLFADGRKSRGREILDPDRKLTYNGYMVWRGLVETPTLRPFVWNADDKGMVPKGFTRFYDIRGGRLFSLTGTIVQSGKSYWEFSHNLPDWKYKALAGGQSPIEHAYILPHEVSDLHREVIHDAASGLPAQFAEIMCAGDISGIPVNDTEMPVRSTWIMPSGAVAALLGDALLPVRLQVGAGLNNGIHQAYDFARILAARSQSTLRDWESMQLKKLGAWVELGRSRAHRNNLGWYIPVRPGKTTAPLGNQWADPEWVTA